MPRRTNSQTERVCVCKVNAVPPKTRKRRTTQTGKFSTKKMLWLVLSLSEPLNTNVYVRRYVNASGVVNFRALRSYLLGNFRARADWLTKLWLTIVIAFITERPWEGCFTPSESFFSERNPLITPLKPGSIFEDEKDTFLFVFFLFAINCWALSGFFRCLVRPFHSDMGKEVLARFPKHNFKWNLRRYWK